MIGEKRPRENPASLPSKKGKAINSPKGNESASMLKAKKKATRLDDMAA